MKTRFNRNEILSIIKQGYIQKIKNQVIADTLNEKGFRTKRGYEWKKVNVSTFLKVEDPKFFNQYRKLCEYTKVKKSEPISENIYTQYEKPEEPKREVLPQVINKDNKFIVTSLNVAEVFGKEHHNVLKAIDSIIPDLDTQFAKVNFNFTTYSDNQGKYRRSCQLTKNGFSILVMGFTGKEALKFKQMYIKEFDRMESEINKRSNQAHSTGDIILTMAQGFKELESRIDKVENIQKQAIDRLNTQEKSNMLPFNLAVRDKIRERIDNYALSTGSQHHSLWIHLYQQFLYRYKIDVRKRLGNAKKQGLDVSGLDIVDELGRINDLWALACELFQDVSTVEENLSI